MKKYNLVVFYALMFVISSCGGNSSSFKGTWQFSYADEDMEEDYILWLDPDGKTVNQNLYSNVLGVIRSRIDCGGNFGTTFAEITEFEPHGNSAEIKYRHTETGEIHKASLTLFPEDNTLQWEYVGLHKSGNNTPKEYNPSDAENPAYLEPNNTKFTKTSDSPNYKEISPENVVLELPNSIYYTENGETSELDDDGSWMVHNQLRCQSLKEGTDNIIYDTTYEWGSEIPFIINDIWPMADNRGVYFTIWDGGTQFQTISLYKTDGSSKANIIDEVEGLRFSPLNDDVSDEDVPSVAKENGKIRVYDPQKKQTRDYDL